MPRMHEIEPVTVLQPRGFKLQYSGRLHHGGIQQLLQGRHTIHTDIQIFIATVKEVTLSLRPVCTTEKFLHDALIQCPVLRQANDRVPGKLTAGSTHFIQPACSR